MRVEVTIPDELLDEARRKAGEAGVSIDHFVTEAVAQHLEDETRGPEMTPDLLASLQRAEGDIAAGMGRSLGQVLDSVSDKRAEWLRANPH